MVIAVVVIALAVYGWWVFLGPGSNPYKGLRTHSDIQMTDEIRALIEQRIAVTRASIEAQGEEVDADLYILLANDESLLGNLDRAREAAEKAVQLNPLNFAALNLLGSIEEDMYDYDAAREAYKATIDQTPDVEEFYRDYVVLMQAHWPEEREEIKAALEASIADYGRTAWNVTELARWYTTEGDCERAEDHYDLATKLDPGNAGLAAEAEAAEETCQAEK